MLRETQEGKETELLLVSLAILITKERNEKTRTYRSILLGVTLAVIAAWLILPGPALHEGKTAAYAYLRDHPEELEKLKQGAKAQGDAR